MISYFPNSQIRWPSIEELVASLLVMLRKNLGFPLLTDGVLPNQLYTIRCANSCENKASEDAMHLTKTAMMAK